MKFSNPDVVMRSLKEQIIRTDRSLLLSEAKTHPSQSIVAEVASKYQYSRVLADFYKFHWTSEVYATLDMKNRFLGVQISLIWVVFAVKTVTLLWQPVKSVKSVSSIAICC